MKQARSDNLAAGNGPVATSIFDCRPSEGCRLLSAGAAKKLARKKGRDKIAKEEAEGMPLEVAKQEIELELESR